MLFTVSFIMCFLAAVIFAIVMVLIRAMRHLHWSILNAFLNFFGIWIALGVWLIYRYFIVKEPIVYDLTWMEYLILLIIGCIGNISGYLGIKSL